MRPEHIIFFKRNRELNNVFAYFVGPARQWARLAENIFLLDVLWTIYPVASHPRHRALFELKSILSFYVQFWHSEANLNIPKISWYSQSPNILHKIWTFQNTVNFLGKILILLGFEFALCFFGFEMVAHGRFLQGIDVLHTVIESLRIIAGAGADKTETSR